MEREYEKVYLPYYLCGCIRNILYEYHVLYEFYHIDDEFRPIFDKKLNHNECLFIVNYFGQFSNDELILFKKKYNTIFIDNTQSFFQRPIKGIDTAYSCRKYFGVSDGAYLSTDLESSFYNTLSFDISHDKMIFPMGRFETTATEYYNLFLENENINRGSPVKKCLYSFKIF
jgi:hypothetical protein